MTTTQDLADSYCYVWHRADTGIPVYVGKGRGDRYKIHLTEYGHNKRVYWTLKKAQGFVVFPYMSLTDKVACLYERCLIADIGREDLGQGTLYNLTNGGDGTRGWVLTKKQRAKLKAALKMMHEDPTFRARHALNIEAMRGNPEHAAKTKAGKERKKAEDPEAWERSCAKMRSARAQLHALRPTAGGRCYELMLEGKTNREIWELIRVEFNLPESKRIYIYHYRCRYNKTLKTNNPQYVRHVPIAERCRGLIADGLNDDEIWKIIQKAYPTCKRRTLAHYRWLFNKANGITATRAATAASRCYEMIDAGKTNAEIWAVIKVEFNLTEEKQHYPASYRWKAQRVKAA
jgi:hypothetical protein